MTTATIDGLEVAYMTRDSAPALLMLAPEFRPVMPPEQTPERVRDCILEFGRAHRRRRPGGGAAATPRRCRRLVRKIPTRTAAS